MNRIESKFQELRQNDEKALVGFVTAGDPDVAQSLEIISAMCAAGTSWSSGFRFRIPARMVRRSSDLRPERSPTGLT